MRGDEKVACSKRKIAYGFVKNIKRPSLKEGMIEHASYLVYLAPHQIFLQNKVKINDVKIIKTFW